MASSGLKRPLQHNEGGNSNNSLDDLIGPLYNVCKRRCINFSTPSSRNDHQPEVGWQHHNLHHDHQHQQHYHHHQEIQQPSSSSEDPNYDNSLKDHSSYLNPISEDTNRPKQLEDRKFRNKAMLSEWLVDRPMNFESEWLLKVTPVGRRCLVFSRKGETVAYSRTGQFIKAFQSCLPGGCPMNISHCRRQFAIVDCIYVQNNNSFYLMDALAWNEHKLYESEASFRFFWLQSRYNENQEKFVTTSSRNNSRFYCLNTYSASNQDILKALDNDPIMTQHNLQLDGLLFFHIRGPYVPGANPLVLWLKPEMVDRVLD